MKYAVFASIFIPFLYLFGYIRYIWKVNKLSAVGALIVGILAVILPFMVIFMR